MSVASAPLTILGIETSCDETSAAVVREGPRLLAQVLESQMALHRPFGGVVPEIACRSHVETLVPIVERCMQDAGVTPAELSGIAVTQRPGLIGALLIGVTTAKALAWAWDLPLIAVNHLQAHLEAPALCGERVPPPYLGVVLSGGHTDLYAVRVDGYERIGKTRDDAVGEAFDKVATILGLSYPGGPAIEAEARTATAGDGDGDVRLPRTLLERESLDFSFSGLKTAVLYLWRGQDGRQPGPIPGAPPRAKVAAAFQEAVADVLIEKIRRALAHTGFTNVVFGGGVTANQYLRGRFDAELADVATRRVFPEPRFSTDNGAMIAALGLEQLRRGDVASLDLEASASP